MAGEEEEQSEQCGAVPGLQRAHCRTHLQALLSGQKVGSSLSDRRLGVHVLLLT